MRRKISVAPYVLSAVLMASAIVGCGKSADTAKVATEEAMEPGSNYVESRSSESYAYETSDATTDEAMLEGETAICESATEDCAEIWFPDYEVNTESYDKPDENDYCLVATEPLSTFAADVDTASYANVRRMIESGYRLQDIDPQAVRPEEFINYFKYDLNDPEGNDKFGITTEIAKCPWNENHELMFVGMKTQDIDLDKAPSSNLVFLIDVSGSMYDDDKLPLLQKAFTELVDTLPDNGTVSIVTYAGDEKVVLSGESMANKAVIKDAIDALEAGGSTNGEAGIKKAYDIAKNNYIEGGINRVILATDGDLNVGLSSPEELERMIKTKKDDGIFLSVIGFGDGNYKDDNLERIADCGNGNYSYIDSAFEGKKVLVDEMGSTLVTVAKDVKLQVEFNPEKVNAYRLIGYENRLMAAADFNDDTKDGGEIGAGHSVVALYEIIPFGSEDEVNLKYQHKKNPADTEKEDSDLDEDVFVNAKDVDYSDEYATVSVRYKEPDANKSQLFSVTVGDDDFNENPSENLRFAGMVAEFAMIVGDSSHKGTATLTGIMEEYKTLENTDDYKDEFKDLVRMMAKRS